jgi:hypothetical protein
VVAVAAVLALALVPGSALASYKSFTFSTYANLLDPCTGNPIYFTGKGTASVEVAQPHDIQVEFNDQEKASGGYQLTMQADGWFYNKASYYDIPYTIEVTGPTSFTATGIERVYVNSNQKPTGSSLRTYNATCNDDNGQTVSIIYV